jgi:hypothetical protein
MDEFKKVQRANNLAMGDFPSVDRFKEILKNCT